MLEKIKEGNPVIKGLGGVILMARRPRKVVLGIRKLKKEATKAEKPIEGALRAEIPRRRMSKVERPVLW